MVADATIWEQELKSPDELLRSDVGRRVTHLLWRLEFAVENGNTVEERVYAAQILSALTQQSIDVR